ncbi:MAG: glycosyl transferase [Alphaproteobacteria bacterium]|nr:glycosyl transferase [Alphaproteobacteria bacterium]
MAKIAYILLCHANPEALIAQVRQLITKGDFVSIHFDGRAKPADFDAIKAAFNDVDQVVFADRVKCGWGEWSLVQATLNALARAVEAFPRASHFYMVSGDCMPIKSAEYAHEFLDTHDVDYIESFDYYQSDWIKTGMKEERLNYRHFLNERKHKTLFYAALNVQKRLGLERKPPKDLEINVGSQWWCLRRKTIEAILTFLAERPDVLRFFRTTWIPDETFFQTLVRHLVPHSDINPSSLTFLMFSDYGMPVTFYNDQYDMLLSQDFLFARKISSEAHDLKTRLGRLYASGKRDFNISNEGRRLYHYLTQQGRHGRRFAPRFWERESTLGRERELLILICKKWHVAKRLLDAIRHATNLSGVAYLFDEENPGLPHLGGIENSKQKRARHRRAMMRMLFDYYDTNQLVICLDPNNLDLLQDFYSDRCTTRILEVECSFDDAYLVGHAKRVGLASDTSSPQILTQLTPTIRQEFSLENDRLRDADFAHYYRISEQNTDIQNTQPMSAFLDIPAEIAAEIVATDGLFNELDISGGSHEL